MHYNGCRYVQCVVDCTYRSGYCYFSDLLKFLFYDNASIAYTGCCMQEQRCCCAWGRTNAFSACDGYSSLTSFKVLLTAFPCFHRSRHLLNAGRTTGTTFFRRQRTIHTFTRSTTDYLIPPATDILPLLFSDPCRLHFLAFTGAGTFDARGSA